MSVNSFGRLFRFSTWGESHGPAIGALVDGCPPGLALDEAGIQHWLDRRRPGASGLTSARAEPDRARILSGTYHGLTTGTPISIIIDNVDARPADYPPTAPYRPGHADYAYDAKYGVRDPRGGGRASARETAARVAAGAVARLVIPAVAIAAEVIEVGGETGEERWTELIEAARAAGSSLGGVVECVAHGVPAGWGAPVYAKLDAELAAAIMSINAVKGVEIGDGFKAARLRGEENADAMRPGGASEPEFLSNHAGGIVGGISTGQPILLRAAFKPTSSITAPVETVDARNRARTLSTVGRHDPCVALRGAAVVEAMMALVLADHKLLHRAQCGGEKE